MFTISCMNNISECAKIRQIYSNKFLILQTFNTQILLSNVFKMSHFTNNIYRRNDFSVCIRHTDSVSPPSIFLV